MLLKRHNSRRRFNLRQKFKLTNFHPHIIIEKSDKFLKSLTINHIISIIIIGFFLLFGILALYLPREVQHRSFQPFDGNIKRLAERLDLHNKNLMDLPKHKIKADNIDPEGHVQIFYYPWYGNPEHDGNYIHWNHDILPHWQAEVNKKYKIGEKYNVLKDEIGANYFPFLGPYSSSDQRVIEQHFKMLLAMNISVIVVSWHSPIAIENNPDKAFSEKDKITANNLDLLFKYALVFGIKIAIHLEPYNGRTAESTYKDLKYLNDNYSKLESYYKSAKYNNKPFYYMYDSYKMDNNEWKKLLVKGIDNKLCVRDTELDGIFLGLYLNKHPSETHILQSGFDGFYTYFAADGFTDGSSPNKHWKRIAKWALQNRLVFIPSIGPGYNDLRVRPWNEENSKDRNKGEYYKRFWNQVFDINNNLIKEMKEKIPHKLIGKSGDIYEEKKENNNDKDVKTAIEYVSITSFNEWHEGTQIEPCVAKISKNGYKYMDFEEEGGPDAYMKMTHKFVNSFLKQV
eukprot:545538_1